VSTRQQRGGAPRDVPFAASSPSQHIKRLHSVRGAARGTPREEAQLRDPCRSARRGWCTGAPSPGPSPGCGQRPRTITWRGTGGFLPTCHAFFFSVELFLHNEVVYRIRNPQNGQSSRCRARIPHMSHTDKKNLTDINPPPFLSSVHGRQSLEEPDPPTDPDSTNWKNVLPGSPTSTNWKNVLRGSPTSKKLVFRPWGCR